MTVLCEHVPDAEPGVIGDWRRDGAGWTVTICPNLPEREAVEILIHWWSARSWLGMMAALSYAKHNPAA